MEKSWLDVSEMINFACPPKNRPARFFFLFLEQNIESFFWRRLFVNPRAYPTTGAAAPELILEDKSGQLLWQRNGRGQEERADF